MLDVLNNSMEMEIEEMSKDQMKKEIVGYLQSAINLLNRNLGNASRSIERIQKAIKMLEEM